MKQPLLSEISRLKKLKLFTEHVAPGASVLEVGAATGFFSEDLRERGYKVTTLDLKEGCDIQGDINSWRELGIPMHCFDAVVALEVTEHVNCVDAIKNICKEDGFIFLSSPHPNWDWVMRILEILGLNQPRTSPHDNLMDYTTLPLDPIVLKRPAFIHQVGLFRNAAKLR
jgi:2-polyprenyl-3-methyl-5-hydroxy-6-metoxy-1,4-benzoquinol methylase